QRVQLAAALVHDPELLVLDEPFSGLDPVGVDVLADVLKAKAAEGTPVIFSSHQLELVERLCEAVAIVNQGRLVATGGVAELRAAASHRRYEIGVAGAPAHWPSASRGRPSSTRRRHASPGRAGPGRGGPTAGPCSSSTTTPTSRRSSTRHVRPDG
ncbi:MAG TPA: AAA family ATPase, partial [Actinomycetota bacterium]|nr:AAA family ATPase [Actinomycetota bacterium]